MGTNPWDKRLCPVCNRFALWEVYFNGTATCTACGVLNHSGAFEGFEASFVHGYSPLNTLQQNIAYTREKRFQKYLNRASMKQSMNSVPDETWKFLLKNKPYTGPGHIMRTLKKSRLRRKCYDCLPLITFHMCPACKVPRITERENKCALEYFRSIDRAFPHKGSFMSYLFILEFVLCAMGRSDMMPFLSRIKCKKRRAKYGHRLSAIIRDALSDGSLRV